jgi:alpha-amylase/alpha-mannosidase (GH57 family)
MTRTALMLLWHMHQPSYKDLAEGVYTMPWVRLHALKDYYGMVAILEEFPSVHMTFNLVPSLLAQLEDYARGTAREPSYDTSFKTARNLTSDERESLVSLALQANRENLINRYPRFRELDEKARATGVGKAAGLFTDQELLDLQVLSQLAWFDEIELSEDLEIRALIARERNFGEGDKSLLYLKEIALFNKALEEYRRASQRGQIEISTSPFYHPILPLVADTHVALESHPGVNLPRHRFRHPEDAQGQLRSAVEQHQRLFGRRPRGLWPSEGGVSDEVLRIAAAEGFDWAATDEGVLGRTLQMGFYRQGDGTVLGGGELYRPHRFVGGERPISLFFRDHQLSDLIGFVYSRMDPEAAAHDLYNRIRAAGRSTGDRPAVVSIILDGENAWEFFPGNGREFLKRFYRLLESDPEVRAVTASEALTITDPGTLKRVVPGSWIDANFDVWIGSDEDNRAWDLLSDARDFFAENVSKAAVPEAQKTLAQEELWIAEGSDWCWWYGPEHSTSNDEEFDLLYRKHLSNIYRMLGSSPPDELAVPIKRRRAGARHTPPTSQIHPSIDGEVTTYFEWMGAGVYCPDGRSGSMHGAGQFVEALYYGSSGKSLCLRLDLNESFRKVHPEFEVRMKVEGDSGVRLHVNFKQDRVAKVEFWNGNQPAPAPTDDQLQVAYGDIFELRMNCELLGAGAQSKVLLQISLWVNELPVQIIPGDGWLTVDLTDLQSGW